MHAGRMGAIANFAKRYHKQQKDKDGKPKLKKHEIELQELLETKTANISGHDIYENTKTRLRFRKFPWSHWIMALIFLGSAFFIIYMVMEDLVKFKKKIHEYLLIIWLLVTGFAFLLTGKIKSTIFDKKEQTVIIRKRTISCHCRSITAYNLKTLRDVRAVWRGLKAGDIDNRHYAIVLEFDQN